MVRVDELSDKSQGRSGDHTSRALSREATKSQKATSTKSDKFVAKRSKRGRDELATNLSY